MSDEPSTDFDNALERATTAIEARVFIIKNEALPDAIERRNKGIEMILREGLIKDETALIVLMEERKKRANK